MKREKYRSVCTNEQMISIVGTEVLWRPNLTLCHVLIMFRCSLDVLGCIPVVESHPFLGEICSFLLSSYMSKFHSNDIRIDYNEFLQRKIEDG